MLITRKKDCQIDTKTVNQPNRTDYQSTIIDTSHLYICIEHSEAQETLPVVLCGSTGVLWLWLAMVICVLRNTLISLNWAELCDKTYIYHLWCKAKTKVSSTSPLAIVLSTCHIVVLYHRSAELISRPQPGLLKYTYNQTTQLASMLHGKSIQL